MESIVAKHEEFYAWGFWEHRGGPSNSVHRDGEDFTKEDVLS